MTNRHVRFVPLGFAYVRGRKHTHAMCSDASTGVKSSEYVYVGWPLTSSRLARETGKKRWLTSSLLWLTAQASRCPSVFTRAAVTEFHLRDLGWFNCWASVYRLNQLKGGREKEFNYIHEPEHGHSYRVKTKYWMGKWMGSFDGQQKQQQQQLDDDFLEGSERRTCFSCASSISFNRLQRKHNIKPIYSTRTVLKANGLVQHCGYLKFILTLQTVWMQAVGSIRSWRLLGNKVPYFPKIQNVTFWEYE